MNGYIMPQNICCHSAAPELTSEKDVYEYLQYGALCNNLSPLCIKLKASVSSTFAHGIHSLGTIWFACI